MGQIQTSMTVPQWVTGKTVSEGQKRELRVLFVGLPGANPCGMCMRIVQPGEPDVAQREVAEIQLGGSGIQVADIQRHNTSLSMLRVAPGDAATAGQLRALWEHYYDTIDVLVLAIPAAGGGKNAMLRQTQHDFESLWNHLYLDEPRLKGKRIVLPLDVERDAATEDELHHPDMDQVFCVDAVSGLGMDELVDKICGN
jgi:hypothetical protein